MKNHLILLLALLTMNGLTAQDELPYAQIPDAPADYGPGNVLARLVDGLGFRFYWATEGLREEDLAYKISEDARSTEETINHILGMSNGILRTVTGVEGERYDYDALSYNEKRALALQNYAQASETLRGMKKKEVEKLEIVFGSGDNRRTFPFWNMINGQISDSIYHTGQVVSYRRASGNPIAKGVNVFMGTKR